MLHDLSFLERGKPWPPAPEQGRLETYKAHKSLFQGGHAEQYKEQFKRVQRVIGCYSDVIIYPVALNYHRLISIKTADLIFSEPPQITVATDPGQKLLDAILKDTSIIPVAYQSAIDVSRYGDAVLTKTSDDTTPRVLANSPEFWFPVVDRANIKPGRRWESIVEKVITVLVAALVGFLLANIGIG